ncbi:MAG: putative toxin-antitoxin system toxin component, PIN family [Methylovulum sp.]|nr:putative toxin-antitoxin system toxin component, PIN family [Methylovulum sp.]
MKNKVRVVIDTNVAVSAALLPRSVSRQAFDFVVSQAKLLMSEETLSELDEVLCRPKFSKYVSEKQRLAFFAALVREVEFIQVIDAITECRDKKDNKFLELAVSGKASYILSGDNDLLVLNPFRGVVISSPASFLESASTSIQFTS